MAAKSVPDVAYLRECFDLNPLTWKRRPREHFGSDHAWVSWNARFPGLVAGTYKHAQGYVIVCLDNVRYKAHRLIWMMQTGTQPPPQLDHRNSRGLDNQWRNLRPVTQQQNSRNQRKRRGQELPKGVYRERGGRYRASAGVDGKKIYLGAFDTPEEAHAAYCAFASQQFGEFFNPG